MLAVQEVIWFSYPENGYCLCIRIRKYALASSNEPTKKKKVDKGIQVCVKRPLQFAGKLGRGRRGAKERCDLKCSNLMSQFLHKISKLHRLYL